MASPSTPARAPTDRQRAVVVLLGALLLGALTARLGVWQLDRAAQKAPN
jgi:cytochrome oxidase assembly protein ShyY1